MTVVSSCRGMNVASCWASEAVASLSRSQRAMWPTTTPKLSDLPRTVRGRPLASAGVCGGCYSVSYSPAKGANDGNHDLIVPATDRSCDA